MKTNVNSQTYRHKTIKITVGHEIAMYKWDQLCTYRAMLGNKITPIDQNCSKRVVTMVFGFPPVMSETKMKINQHEISKFSILSEK